MGCWAGLSASGTRTEAVQAENLLFREGKRERGTKERERERERRRREGGSWTGGKEWGRSERASKQARERERERK